MGRERVDSVKEKGSERTRLEESCLSEEVNAATGCESLLTAERCASLVSGISRLTEVFRSPSVRKRLARCEDIRASRV